MGADDGGWADSDDVAWGASGGGGGSGGSGDMEYLGYSTHTGTGGGGAGASAGGLHPLELGVLETAREDEAGNAITRSVPENVAASRRAAMLPQRWSTIALTAFSHPRVHDTATMMGPTSAAQRSFGRGDVVCARDFMAIPIPIPIPIPVPPPTLGAAVGTGAGPAVVARPAASASGPSGAATAPSPGKRAGAGVGGDRRAR
jgi:hypothetical protein